MEFHKTEPTTFSMDLKIKEKAKVYVAANNRHVKEIGEGEKVNLGLLLNKALEIYLSKIKDS